MLFTEKKELSKYLYKLQDSLNDKLNQENILIEQERTEKFIYENKKNFKLKILKNKNRKLKKMQKLIIRLLKKYI